MIKGSEAGTSGSAPRLRGRGESHSAAASSSRISPAPAGKSVRRPASRRSGTDQPRACGEEGRVNLLGYPVNGSAPRLRGRVHLAVEQRVEVGISPAPAGKRPSWRRRPRRPPDQPRACGEEAGVPDWMRRAWGSAPRLRGRVPLATCGRAHSGISPAPAGKRCSAARAAGTSRDQPRACGEEDASSAKIDLDHGSAPRLRGRDRAGRVLLDDAGISPAPAGKSAVQIVHGVEDQDQPRACGEERACASVRAFRNGSAPRLRGRASKWVPAEVWHRISPAPAGKSAFRCHSSTVTPDQPRACGEEGEVSLCSLAHGGSAPRLRGRGGAGALSAEVQRISPAPAGKSRRAWRASRGGRDQPRACGEEEALHLAVGVEDGSAPRLRGRGRRRRAPRRSRRISPAPAGKREHQLPRLDVVGDQPRACGEELWPITAPVAILGSAPRLRGRASYATVVPIATRISPAPAGKSN